VTRGDLIIGTSKVVGSAQRRQRGALLQHGAILLAASPHARVLPGILELTGIELDQRASARALLQTFARATGWELSPAEWTAAEYEHIEELVATKYTQPVWNHKR
jgi:lipoate-protein ligase A